MQQRGGNRGQRSQSTRQFWKKESSEGPAGECSERDLDYYLSNQFTAPCAYLRLGRYLVILWEIMMRRGKVELIE